MELYSHFEETKPEPMPLGLILFLVICAWLTVVGAADVVSNVWHLVMG